MFSPFCVTVSNEGINILTLQKKGCLWCPCIVLHADWEIAGRPGNRPQLELFHSRWVIRIWGHSEKGTEHCLMSLVFPDLSWDQTVYPGETLMLLSLCPCAPVCVWWGWCEILILINKRPHGKQEESKGRDARPDAEDVRNVKLCAVCLERPPHCRGGVTGADLQPPRC